MSYAGNVAWPFYLKKFNEIISKYELKDILKTDCNNEAYSRPKKGGLVYNLDKINNLNVKLLEYDIKVINDALTLFPDLNVEQGDIRNLLFNNEEFDLVADFSTIDHIPDSDLHKTIKEYLRVTKKTGFVILVIWLSYKKEDVIANNDKWRPECQYFFWEDDIIEYIKKESATILETETIVTIDYELPNRFAPKEKKDSKYYLKYFLLKK